MRETFPGAEPVELAGEWPPGAPSGVFSCSGDLDELFIDRADPRLVISAELVDHIVDHPHPMVFVDPAGGGDYVGALLKIYGVNRNVVYRLTERLPSIHAFVAEFV